MKFLLKKREKIMLYFAVAAAGFSLLFNAAVSPALKRNESLNSRIRLSEAKLAKYNSLLTRKAPLMAQYDKFSSSAGLSGSKGDLAVAVLSELEATANNSNIRIIDVRPQTGRRIDIYKEIVIELRAQGTLESFLKFMYNIENSLSLLKINRFQLTALPNSTNLEGALSISKLITSD